MADLGRWLRGDYRIASGPLSPDVDDEPADEETTAPGGQDR
jgi:endogenous inhibitor of DNA gyrase (YacG/DUF329 family)